MSIRFLLINIFPKFFSILFLISLILNVTYVSAATVNINPSVQYQSIDGFGGSTSYAETPMATMQEPAKSQMYDLLFSAEKGIGLTIVRNHMWPAFHPDINTYNWSETNLVHSVTIWNEAKSRGAEKFYTVPWSPPAWMKSNNNVKGGGTLLKEYYQAYADQFSEYVRGMRSRFGIDVYSMSVQNEPDFAASYEACIWDGWAMLDFIGNYIAPTFARDGVTTKMMLTEKMNWDEGPAQETLNNATAAAMVNVVSAHGYRTAAKPFTLAKSKNKRVWQTEDSNLDTGEDKTITDGLFWAKKIHDYLVVGEVNAWLYWWLAQKTGDGQTLIQINSSTSITVPKRVYTLGNYSKFVRPGYVRINATASPESGVYVSAYKDPSSGKIVIVAINDNTSDKSETFTTTGLGTQPFTPYTTSASQNLGQGTAITANNGSFSATLGAKSVVSFVSGSVTPNPTPTIISTPTINPTVVISPSPTKTPTPQITPTVNTTFDVNKDGVVNLLDVIAVLNEIFK